MIKNRFRFYALKLCAIIFVIFLVQLVSSSFTDLFLLNSGSFIQPWRFLTSIFLHGSFMHLFYNLFALALFGSMLERLIGSKRFLIVFFVTGILANLVSVNFYDNSLGASGAIFGIIGALIFVRPLMVIWAFGLPMPIFIAGILWAAGDIIGFFVPSNVANLAHLSGMFFGLIIGVFYRKNALRLV
ncbi:MAG: rhomboid family intramembrane serine protease [Candidatus Pacearchaeota archaeon]